MKRFKNILIIVVFLLFFISSRSSADDKYLKILFTNDIHDHVESLTIYKNKKILNIGGYNRLSTK